MWDATPLLRAYAARRIAALDRQDAAAAQTRTLRRLLRSAAATRFGREHGFAGIRTVAEFQARVPVRRYEELWRDYWQPAFPVLRDLTWPGTIPYFAASSGTTSGTTKFIPCSRQMVRANVRAGFEVLVHHVRRRPDSRILGGKSFMLGGSTRLVERAPGVRSGDLSGIAAARMPRWLQPRIFPPADLAAISDWEEKVDRLAPRSLAEDIRCLGGTPSWLLLFVARLAALAPDRPQRLASYYPHLELLVHGGVDFAPYRRQFEALLAGSRAELREVYPASEGFMAVADRGPGEGLRLILDNGLFFEFVPVEELDSPNPTRHWIGTAEPGVNYAIVLSTCAGLWAYRVGDTVRLTGTKPPRLLVTGRTSYSLSAFGEHLIGEELEQAVAAAAQAIGRMVADWTVTPVFPARPEEWGGHLFVVEFSGGEPPEAAARDRFAQALDARLQALNLDYAEHRRAMNPPIVRPMPPGGFAAWMKSRGKLGGQNKVPRVITAPDLLDSLRPFFDAAGEG